MDERFISEEDLIKLLVNNLEPDADKNLKEAKSLDVLHEDSYGLLMAMTGLLIEDKMTGNVPVNAVLEHIESILDRLDSLKSALEEEEL